MTGMWFVQRRTGDAGVVDVAWSPGIAFFAPILMLFFLFRVTGIPATEARALVTRGDAYRRYQKTTSPFVPWPPRSIDS